MESGSLTNGITLLPCPFCGAEPEPINRGEYMFFDHDDACHFEMLVRARSMTRSVKMAPDEIEAWNTRATHGGTRWERLFGTPERAARTSWYMLMCKHMDCDECPIADGCDIATDIYCDDGEAALLEWLRGDAE